MSIELKKNFQIIKTSNGATHAIGAKDLYALSLLKQYGGEKIAGEVAVIIKISDSTLAWAAEQAFNGGADEYTIDMSKKEGRAFFK